MRYLFIALTFTSLISVQANDLLVVPNTLPQVRVNPYLEVYSERVDVTGAMAQARLGYNNRPTFDRPTVDRSGSILSYRLQNGSVLSSQNDVRWVEGYGQNGINFIELNNGNIFYDSEIKDVLFKFGKDGSTITIPTDIISIIDGGGLGKHLGGDGSGGG